MKLFAQVNNQGTAMAETALCSHHFATHKDHMATDHDYEGVEKDGPRVELTDTSWHDCTGNDALSCNVCGVTVHTPDLVGKTVKNIQVGSYFGDDPNVLIEAPSTTLWFTDGSRHTFIHPTED